VRDMGLKDTVEQIKRKSYDAGFETAKNLYNKKEEKMHTVTTQYMENYGAHDSSGKFKDGKNFWKFKGGTTYVVTGAETLSNAVAFIASIATENNIFCKEYVSHYEVGARDEVIDDCAYVKIDVNEYMNASNEERNKLRKNFIYPKYWSVDDRTTLFGN
jgi:hypothetical protein